MVCTAVSHLVFVTCSNSSSTYNRKDVLAREHLFLCAIENTLVLRYPSVITSEFAGTWLDNASLFLRSSFGVVSEWYRSGNGVCSLCFRYPSVRVRDKLYCQLSEINVGILFLFAIHLVCSLCFVFEHLYERGWFYDSDIRSVCA